MDYIDIPSFIRSFLRYARKYILFIVPIIICTMLCLAMLSKAFTRKEYIAGGTSMIGLRLSDTYFFDYTFSGLSWDRQSTLTYMSTALKRLVESGYISQFAKESMGLKRHEKLSGEIFIDVVNSTNLINIYAVSELPEDAEAIRDAVFACFPDAVFPAIGFIEMDIKELYTKEESSTRAFLASPKVWVAGGIALGIIGYLGLVFLYTLRRRDVETPRDLEKLTSLSCLGRLPALKRRIQFRKRGNTEKLNESILVTKEYQNAFERFRNNVSEEIWQRQCRVILMTGNGQLKGQTTIAAELEKAWLSTGRKVIRTDLSSVEGPMTEEKVRCALDQYLEEAELVLIDGPSCDKSADYLILADCADAMIIVIREGQNQPDEIKEMFQSLQYAGASPLGYVLNICSYLGA